MDSLDVYALFTNIQLDETTNVCSKKVFLESVNFGQRNMSK